ncbi:MAG: hypothetical protein R3C01_15085 [Planctomycetaceae bacterium]
MIAPRQNAAALLDKQFLEMRCGLLDLAAAFDRIERASGSDGVLAQDERVHRLQEGLRILLNPGTNRAEQIQLLFSDAYIENWSQSKR